MATSGAESDGARPPVLTAGAALASGVEYSVMVGDSFSHDADHRFHTLQYNFKPGSILSDEGHDGQLLLSGERNAEQARVEFHHRNGAGRRVVCRGRRRASKDNEVLLIFDPRTQRFLLERVSGFVTGLRHERDPEDSALADEESSHKTQSSHMPSAAAAVNDSDSDGSLSDLDSDSDSVAASGVSATAPASAKTTSGKGPMQGSGGEGDGVAAKRRRVEHADSSDLSDSD